MGIISIDETLNDEKMHNMRFKNLIERRNVT